MLRVLLAVVVVLGSACATTPPPSTSSPIALRYAWPAGSEAMVEESIDKNGSSAIEKYRVRLVPVAGAGGQQDLVIDELKMVAINGNVIDTDEERARVAPAEQMAASIPHLRIDSSGAVIDVVGLDEMRAALVAVQPEAERERFAQVIASPEMTMMMQASALNIWNGWVGGYNGLDLVAGTDTVKTTPVDGPDGPLQQETHLLLKIVGERVVITTSTKTPKEIALALVRPMLENLLQQAHPDAPATLEQLEQFSIETTSTAELDPKTLRPWRVETKREIRALVAGKALERNETHKYFFTWK